MLKFLKTQKGKSMSAKKSANVVKEVYVNRKFLNDFAKKIYDPKTKKFTRLCHGTLVSIKRNKDKKIVKVMHCGLGELYYAMTGTEPKTKSPRTSEDDVVDLAVELSSFKKAEVDLDAKFKSVLQTIDKLAISDDSKYRLRNAVAFEKANDDSEEQFRNLLTEIQSINDDCGDESCTVAVYKERAKAVAEQIKAAAKFLPE